MRLADKMIAYMKANDWRPAALESDHFHMELNEVHGLLEVGFMFWRKLPDGRLDLLTSGHTYNGQLVGAENHPLEVSHDIVDQMSDLLDRRNSVTK